MIKGFEKNFIGILYAVEVRDINVHETYCTSGITYSFINGGIS